MLGRIVKLNYINFVPRQLSFNLAVNNRVTLNYLFIQKKFRKSNLLFLYYRSSPYKHSIKQKKLNLHYLNYYSQFIY